MRRHVFDLAGVLSVLAFAAVVVADLPELRLHGGDMPVAVSAAERQLGFREGDSWYAFFLLDSEDVKVGYSKVERRRLGNQLKLRVASLFRPTILGQTREVKLDLEAILDRWMALESLQAEASTAGAAFRATARVEGRNLQLELSGGGLEHATVIPLEQPITLDLGARPMVLASHPEVGQRFAVSTFDPMSFKVVTTTMTYLGREEIEVLDQKVDSYVVEQTLGNDSVRVWLNELGEVLREEMPLGIVAERVSEADASWGFGAAGQADISAPMAALPELFPGLRSRLQLPGERPSASPPPEPVR